MKSIVSAFFALCLCSTLVAQDSFYDGGGLDPSDWNDPLNWDGDVVPASPTNVIIGDAGGPLASATVNISGPLSNSIVGDLRIANGATGGATGILNHSAGSLVTDTDKWAFVGADGPVGSPNTGAYNLSGSAEFTMGAVGATTGGLYLGIGGGNGTTDGTNQGTVTVADNATMNLNDFSVGSNDGNTGMVMQSGGTVNVNQLYVGEAAFGIAGNGVYDQTDGDVVAQNWVSIGRENGGVGTYNMSGGTLTVSSDFLTIGENTGATGIMNVSGDANISVPNLAVGRFGGGATGTLNIQGDQATVFTLALYAGRNDVNMNMPEDVSGTIRFEASANGVSPINAIGDVFLNDGSVIGSSTLEVDLSALPTTGDVTLITIGGLLDGTFAGLAEGALVPGSGGRTITYTGGGGSDIVLLEGDGTMIDGDFNNDGFYDCADVDGLVAEIVAGTNDTAFDLNSDTNVDGLDLTAWLAEAGEVNIGPGRSYLVGDATLDGTVDGLDFIEWNDNKFTATPAWCSADFNADGTVDGLDFIEWNNNKFTSSDAVAVPEPTALGLLLLGIACLARRKV